MVSKGAKAVLYSIAIGATLLAVLSIVGVIALGAVGIEKAQEENPCRRANKTIECRDETFTDLIVNGTDPFRDDDDLDEFFYWMTGCTAWGIVSAFVVTGAFVVVMSVARKFQQLEKADKEKHKRARIGSDSKPLTTESTEEHRQAADKLAAEEADDDTDGKKEDVIVDTEMFGGHAYRPLERRDLRPFTVATVFAVFFSSVFAIGSLVCLLWGIALAYDHARRVEVDIANFLAVELVIGIILPLFLFLGAVLMSVVLEYLTNGKLNAHKGINQFLPGVTYVVGRKRRYWVIDGTFYFPLRPHSDESIRKTFDPTPATWLIATIVCLTLLLTFSYFVDQTIVEIRTVETCGDVDETYDCFKYDSGEFDYLDCSQPGVDNGVDDLHCFRFLRLGIDVNVISTVSSAFAFYLVVVTFFTKIFSFVKILLHLKPSRFWGIGFILLGVIVFIIALALSIDDNILARLLSLNVIGVAQFMMVCIFLVLVGVLLLYGNWWEKVGEVTRPVETHLVHYSDTTRGHLHKVEREYNREHPSGAGNQPTLGTATTTI